MEQSKEQLHLIFMPASGEKCELWLHQNSDGSYCFEDSTRSYRFLRVESENGRWLARCASPAFFSNVNPEDHRQILLEDQQLLKVEAEETQHVLYVEMCSQESSLFQNYSVHADAQITIGRDPRCDICCGNMYVSRNHALLQRDGKHWTVRDQGSKHGIYVNGRRTEYARLKLGDEVFIMGLRILIGVGFISVNSEGGRATVSDRIIKKPSLRSSMYHTEEEKAQPQTDQFFNRLPRKHDTVEEKIIEVDGPPMSMERAQMPLMLRMGSSMVMGARSMMMGNFTTLISSVLFPLLSNKYTEKQRAEYEQRRLTKYTAYLQDKAAEIRKEILQEERELNQIYPNLEQMLDFVEDGKRLWERRPTDDDFLRLRLGAGDQKLMATIDYPARQFELDTDELEEQMYRMVERPYTIRSVPIMHPFVEDWVLGVLGRRDLALEFTERMLMQTVLLHSYDEVKVILLADEGELERLSYVRYLPHLWDDQRSNRFIATNSAEAYRIGEYLKNVIGEKLDDDRDLAKAMKKRPYFLVFALDKKLYDSIEYIKTVLADGVNHGLSVMAVYDDLPKECHRIIHLNESGTHTVSKLRKDGGEDEHFSFDHYNRPSAERTMKRIANLSLKAVSQAQELPKMITFMEMLRAGRLEHLNPTKRWRENNPVASLAAPVGVATDGTLFTLDLHEKRQGPHGLVAGMTGSGKSEFIITYILSMAVNYHPDEVAFILIDYKGGGLAGAFDDPKRGIHLPHLVGTITNLDGAAIQRSLMAIESELKRRQRVFNETKSATNQGTLDIYGYQKLYRNGRVSEPMPHLFIISDEFAELKQQQPEFMEKLISAARIGRSLGVHLILATQKPAGVVNDQIRSNTKFRVCLRVQDRSDSMDMLKRPEAAELTDTGRFYLQVGYNEFFALGQSAWCGAAYEPQETVQVKQDDSVEILDVSGQLVAKAKPKVKKADSGVKQLVAVVQYLSDIAKREGYVSKSLWTEPLPKQMDLQELYARYPRPTAEEGNIRALLGIVDDPERQSQYDMTLDVQACQNLLIMGEAGSGKSNLLQSLVHSLADTYGPDRVNFYILDYSNKLLAPYRNLPHCGAYLTDEDEETLPRFFEMISDEIDRRKKLFDEVGAISYEAYTKNHSLPLILVVIDSVAGMSSGKIGQNLAYTFHEYIRDGASYGLKFVVSASFSNDLNGKAKQALMDRICLKVKDKYTYGEYLGKRVMNLPEDVPGRGMVLVDGRPLEWHFAVVEKGEPSPEQTERTNRWVRETAQRYAGMAPARRLAVLDPEETYEQFSAEFKPGRIPLGYKVEDVKAVALPLKQMYCLSLYFGNPLGVVPVMRNLLGRYAQEGMELIIVKKRHDSMFADDTPVPGQLTLLTGDSKGVETLWEMLMQEIGERKEARDEYCRLNGIPYGTPETVADSWRYATDYVRSRTRKLMVVFESFRELCVNADEIHQEYLSSVLSFGKGANFWFTGCFYPDDGEKVSSNPIMKAFNPDKHVLLFGGLFNRQGLLQLPMQYRSVNTVAQQYNNFLLHYRENYHTLQMPCGILLTDGGDEDSAAIV